MGKVLKDLIQYNGIDEYCYRHLKHFKQFNINDIICIPSHKPNMAEISKVWVDYKILDYEFVNTPTGVSLEGQNLTGKKVFISANLLLKIEYSAANNYQTLFSANCSIPICTYVTIDDNYSECSSIYPTILIEDIYCEQLDCQKIYLNAVLMAAVDLC